MAFVYLLGGVYLLIGFIYSIYVILNQGGNIFSIPINTLLGPLFAPINAWFVYRRLARKRPEQKL